MIVGFVVNLSKPWGPPFDAGRRRDWEDSHEERQNGSGALMGWFEKCDWIPLKKV
jgi:hypothetical protein